MHFYQVQTLYLEIVPRAPFLGRVELSLDSLASPTQTSLQMFIERIVIAMEKMRHSTRILEDCFEERGYGAPQKRKSDVFGITR